jgi:hypothetical protein
MIADSLFRHATAGLSPSRLDRGIDPNASQVRVHTDSLLEQALSNDLMTGQDWDELTCLLSAMGQVFLRPGDWADLVGRLLSEQLIASGWAWRQRNESMHRLLWLPCSRQHAISACAAVVRDSRSQVLLEPLAILDMADEPEVTGLLVEQLVNPTNDQALRGALLASVTKIRRRRYSPDQLKRVVTAAVELLLDADSGDDAKPMAAELLRELPAGMRQRALGQLRRASIGEGLLFHVVTSGRTRSADTAHNMVARVAAGTVARMPGNVDGAADDMLALLIDELLHSPNLDVRLHAAQLVGATPWADRLADALCAELVKPATVRDAPAACAILAALPFVGALRHRRIVERLTCADGLPGPVVSAAAWTVGHLAGQSDSQFWGQALEKHRQAWQRQHTMQAVATLRGLVYSVGMAGERALLQAIAVDPKMPSPARVAARWWHNLPSFVSASARF